MRGNNTKMRPPKPKPYGAGFQPPSNNYHPMWPQKPPFRPLGSYQEMRFEGPSRGLLHTGPRPMNIFTRNYQNIEWQGQNRPRGAERPYDNSRNQRLDYNRNMGSSMSMRSERSERSETSVRREPEPVPALPPKYNCPKCEGVFDLKYVANKYMGKVPLILSCNHTVCQECIYQGLKSHKFTCPTCKLESIANEEERLKSQSDVQKSFPINLYLFGYITLYKPQCAILRSEESVSFVSSTKVKKNPVICEADNLRDLVSRMKDRCCFLNCVKVATMFCPSCEVIYCTECCVVVHKSLKNLIMHEPVARTTQKFSLNLEKCPDHPEMKTEYLCKNCDVTGCCYCFLYNHGDHERIPLNSLSELEKEDFKKLKLKAREKLRKLLSVKKKILQISKIDTGSIKKQVHKFFADYHAELEKMELMCIEQLNRPFMDNRGLESVQATVDSSADQLKLLLSVNEDTSDKSLNLRGAYRKLKPVEGLPTHLLATGGLSKPIRFTIDQQMMEKMRDCVKIEFDEGSHYRLVTEEDLPDDYVIDDVSDVDLDEDQMSSVTKFLEADSVCSDSTSITRTGVSRRVKPKTKTKDMKKVEVQHINSMNSFFVQLKSDLSELERLENDIDRYVKMGGPEKVAQPQMNDRYLVQYIDESAKPKTTKWCRGRLVEIINGENGAMYDVFLMDYGKTLVVDGNRIKDIPDYLDKRKPFALECMLDNRSRLVWNNKAHLNLAKILNGKEVFMSETARDPYDGILVVELMISSSDGMAASVYDLLIHCHNSIDGDTKNVDQPLPFPAVNKSDYIPLLKVFSNSQKFSKNHDEKVILATVIDPDNIYVHLVKFRSDFDNMCRAMKQAYKRSSSGVIPIEGTYVMVEYKDPVRGNCHRGCVKRTDLINDRVNVMLVDWGFSVVVPVKSVRPLQESFVKLESQAVFVKMAHVLPYGKKGLWPPESIEYINQYHRSKDVLKMTIIETEPQVEVALFDISNHFDLCINAVMVDNNLADSIGPVSRRSKWSRTSTEQPVCLEKLETPFQASLLKREDEAEFEEDLRDVKTRRVEVVKFDNPGMLWIKYLDNQKTEQELYRDLHVHYSQNATTKTDWAIDELCVAQHNNLFHRAKVVELVGDLYKVLLTDKIEEVVVPQNRLYNFEIYFHKYSKIAIQCHLADLKPAGGSDKWPGTLIDCVKDIFATFNRIYITMVEDSRSLNNKDSRAVNMWYGVVVHGDAFSQDTVKYISINRRLVHTGMCTKMKTECVNKVTTGEDLLKSILGISSVVEETKTDVDSKSEDVVIEEQLNVDSADQKSSSSKSEQISDVVEKVNPPQTPEPMEIIEQSTQTSPNKPEIETVPSTEEAWIDVVEKENTASASIPETADEDKSQESPYHKIEREISDWKPPFRFTEREFEGRITCVEIGGTLYLHAEVVDSIYNDMEKNINLYFNNNPPQNVEHAWEPGQLCTIKWQDGNWYRGRILKIKSPEVIQVFMIDFGSDHDMSPENLFREVLYTDVPCFATRARMDRIYAKSGTWLTSDYDRFFALTSDWCKIVVIGALEVELPLVEVYNEKGECINEKLVEVCPNLSRCPHFPTAMDDDEDDEILSIEEVPEDDKPAQVIQKIMDGILDNVQVNVEFKQRPLPAGLVNGDKFLMEIGGVVAYDKVTLRLPNEDLCPEVHTLTENVQHEVENFPKLTDFSVGKPCWAPYSEDNIWYRARVTNNATLSLGHVEVLFVDYGNSESVSVETVKKICPEHMKYPQQSWEAQINFKCEFEIGNTAIMRLLSSMDRKQRFIKLVSVEPLVVDIYDSKRLCYKHILDSGVLTPLKS